MHCEIKNTNTEQCWFIPPQIVLPLKETVEIQKLEFTIFVLWNKEYNALIILFHNLCFCWKKLWKFDSQGLEFMYCSLASRENEKESVQKIHLRVVKILSHIYVLRCWRIEQMAENITSHNLLTIFIFCYTIYLFISSDIS